MSTRALARVERSSRAAVARPRRRRRPSAWHLVLFPLALIFVFPFLQMVLASFMTNAEISSYPPTLFPHQIALKGYDNVLFKSDFPTWVVNSTIVAVVAVCSQLVVCPLAGYAFARLRFRGAALLQLLLLFTVFIPPQVLMIPVYRLYSTLHVVGELPSLFLPFMASALNVFLMRQFFLRLPREIEEAAMIDGCSRLGLLVRVVLPLMRAPLTTVGLLTLLGAWNDFLWPLISISDKDTYTMQLGLITYQGTHHTEWASVMAMNVFVTVPLLVVFLAGQRYFVRSMTFSAIKG